MIQQARSISRPDLVLVGMITIGIVGLAMDRLLHKLELVVAKGMNVQ
jgi:ABC-type nitrate/sulfonate/bicarbonate transport system permease component